MEQRVYPSRNGLPVRVGELELPPSRLDPNKRGNYSLHHLHFTAREMGRLWITQTLRDLEGEQEWMLNDQHNLGRTALHALYSPPDPIKLPTAMHRLDQAQQTGEKLQVKGNRGYVLRPFTQKKWNLIKQEYERII